MNKKEIEEAEKHVSDAIMKKIKNFYAQNVWVE
jgi:hypothetical protein